ncbi:MAG TPA: hypothetical protein VGZ25_05820, partial [Gemmataceae bacterium]|nr:hypothetical protein [Gemmataceae bacterium]
MRITMKASSAACLLVVGLMSLSGCGKQTSEVHGTVTVNGEKVNSGNIVFIAEDGRLDSAVITDGFYTILKAPTGKVKITVESIAPSGSKRGPTGGLAGLPPEMMEQAAAARKGSS